MKNKKGFTLIELLSVIVIFALLLIVILPNIIRLFNNSKKNLFLTESKIIYRQAESNFITNSLFNTNEIEYYKTNNSKEHSLNLSGRNEINYYVKINKGGKITDMLVCDGTYTLIKSNSNGIEEIELDSNALTNNIDCNFKYEDIKTLLEGGIVENTVFDYEYNGINGSDGTEQTFIVSKDGLYKLEVWGAQGGVNSDYEIGGFGGYATGIIYLKRGDNLYINVGGQGQPYEQNKNVTQDGGYNGGGNGYSGGQGGSGGGGATHIATSSGLLSTLKDNQENILIVAGGGGGNGSKSSNNSYGGFGGGMNGVNGFDGLHNSDSSYNGKSATQESGYKFGEGGNGSTNYGNCGGGGGYYGGYGSSRGHGGGGAGSGYIANNKLFNKYMTCYHCTVSNEYSTKTISNEDYSKIPKSNFSKQGNGYAIITYLDEKNMISPIITHKNNIVTVDYNNYGCGKNSVVCKYIKDGEETIVNKDIIKIGFKKGENNLIASISYKNTTKSSEYHHTYVDISDYDFTGEEEIFIADADGYYKLEVWGAQGGANKDYEIGGFGGYSVGTIALNKDDILYINVGGQGEEFEISKNITQNGGYNGGGNGYSGGQGGSGGGGATHIATSSGLLNTFKNNIDNLIIVAGGGGGNGSKSYKNSYGGFGGGINGTNGYDGYNNSNSSYNGRGSTQESGYKFGEGGNGSTDYGNCGGGGGYYGGYGSSRGHGGGGAGSGYIGNPNLINKSMYCYNCTTSDDYSKKTISNNNYSFDPTSFYSKIGSGYAIIQKQTERVELSKPIFDIKGNEVTIKFLADCSKNIITCSYKKNNGENIEVTSSEYIVNFDSDGILEAKVSNGRDTKQSTYTVVYDIASPSINISPNTQNVYINGTEINVNISDNVVGLKNNQKLYYAWSNSKTNEPGYNDYITLTNNNGDTTTNIIIPKNKSISLRGKYYLWIKSGLSDLNNNLSKSYTSESFLFDYAPSISLSFIKTTKSIKINVNATSSSGITKYEYSIDNGSTWIDNGTTNNYTFDDLDNTKYYSIKVRVTNGINLTNTSYSSQTPNQITMPTYSQNDGIVTIKYPNGCGTTYTCSYKKDDDDIINVDNSSINVSFNKYGVVRTYVSDGINTINNSYNIFWFDNTTSNSLDDYNNMEKWNFQNKNAFNITYNSLDKMNNISFRGISGWEYVYIPIQTNIDNSYTITFDYQILTNYDVSSTSYNGIGIQLLKNIGNNNGISNSILTDYLPREKTDNIETKTITFTSSYKSLYLAFNLGMALDSRDYNVKIGNIKIFKN